MWRFLGVVLGLMLTWGVGTVAFRQLATRRYETAVYRPLPLATDHSAELDTDLRELQRRQPGLAQVDRKYLGQPLEETQSYLYTLAMADDFKQWDFLSRLLNEMWVHEREAPGVDVVRVQRLQLFEQRLVGLYAQASLKHRRGHLPTIAPTAWGGRVNLAHRLLIGVRARLWQDWSLWGRWFHAYRVLGQLDDWHRQLDAGTPLTPTSWPELKPVYEALAGANVSLGRF